MDHLLEVTGQAEATHFWYRGFRAFVQPALHGVAGGRRDLHIVDCGCGTGYNLGWLSSHGPAVGLDLSSGGIALARRAGRSVAQADLTRIPFAASAFDLAVSFDVFQCIPDQDAAIAEMVRVVKPGGRIVLTLAAFESLGADHAELWNEVRRYTPGTARRLVTGAGLECERVSFLFGSIFPLMVAVRLTQRLLRPFRRLEADTDADVPPAPVNAILTGLVRAEAALARYVPMPIGSTLLVVARKPESRRSAI